MFVSLYNLSNEGLTEVLTKQSLLKCITKYCFKGKSMAGINMDVEKVERRILNFLKISILHNRYFLDF